MPFSSFSAAGVAAIQVGKVNLNGYPMGITGSLTPGQGAPLKLTRFSKRFGGLLPSPVWATASGDNHRNLHEYAFNAAQMVNVAFMFHANDLDMYASQLNIRKFTDGNSNGVLIQPNTPVNSSQLSVVVTADAQIADPDGTFGQKRFINEIYSLVTVVPKNGNAQEVTPIEWEHEGRPTQAGKFPWGMPFTRAIHGATRAGGAILTSDYPIVLEAFYAAGGETSYTLTYTPATPTATYVSAWKDTGGVIAPYAVTVVGAAATFSALVAGDIVMFRYEAPELLTLI